MKDHAVHAFSEQRLVASTAVSPPGTEDWEATAAAWLFNLFPEYRRRRGLIDGR
jgi:hypothetical protein